MAQEEPRPFPGEIESLAPVDLAGGVRLEGLGHANGESRRARGSLAKLGSVLAGEPSAFTAGSSQAPRFAAEPGGAGAAAGRARGPQEADFDRRDRVSWLRREQPGPQCRSFWSIPFMVRSSAPRSNPHRRCAATPREKRSISSRECSTHEPSDLSTFVHDIGTVVGMQIAQIRILEQVFDIPVRQARLSFGHSIGELSALVLGGVYEMEQLLPVPLSLATDCAELTADTTLGILSVHGATLQIEDVEHLCASISRRGHGLIGPSTYLSPYQVLLLGQHDTLSMLEQEMHEFLPEGVTSATQAEPLAAAAHADRLGAKHSQPNSDGDASHRRRRSEADALQRRLVHDRQCQLRRMEQPRDPG